MEGKKFSRVIVRYLMVFLGISFILVAIGAYFIRSARIDEQAYSIIGSAQKGLSETLTKHLDYLSLRLDRFISENKFQQYIITSNADELMRGAGHKKMLEDGVDIHLFDGRRDRFIPPLPESLISLEPLLKSFDNKEKQLLPFYRFGNRFISIISIPVMDHDQRIGTGFLLYTTSEDRHFWEIIHSTRMTFNRLMIHDGEGRFYNLETGEPIVIPKENIARLLNDASRKAIREIIPDETILPMEGYHGIFYVANTHPWDEQKNAFKFLLFYLCLFILAVTLAASYVIAKVVSRPLEKMSNEAFSIARSPSNIFLDEEKVEYAEFKTLSNAFNQVLASLFSAQEELKSKARKDLETSEERYRLTVEAAPDIITLSRFDDQVLLEVNQTFLTNTGFSREDVIGKTPRELGLFSDPADWKRITGEFLKKDQISGLDIRYHLKDGSLADAILSSRKVDYHGETCIISILSDRTEQKRVEEEKKFLEISLQRAQKMEAIGMLAGGVAHDLNNILSGIVGYPELLLMDLPENSPLRNPLLTIRKSGEKASAIVQDMLAMARRGVTSSDVINLNSIISEHLKSPEHDKMMSYNPDVRIRTNLEPNLLNTIGSDIHLSKTLMNLISNAAEAMPSGGEILLSTENIYIDTPIRGYDAVKEGDYVVLRVSDTGIGISLEDRERIFEPFYTKKKMGRSGTGLGMAVVWGTVKDHKGYIDLQSTPGKGTSFQLYFPATREKTTTDDVEFSLEQYLSNGESILVVDDISEQRDIAATMLKKLGYSVCSMAGGEEAVQYLKQNAVDLVLLDMFMEPGIDGLETYRRIIEIHPGQKAVLVSGYSETDRVREAQRLGAGTYVKKPYLMKSLAPAIRTELGRVANV